jgi:hypothetical protein
MALQVIPLQVVANFFQEPPLPWVGGALQKIQHVKGLLQKRNSAQPFGILK